MEVLAVVITLALPALVVVAFVLLLQTRAKVKKLDALANRVYKRQVSEDLVRMATDKRQAESMRQYVSDMFEGEEDA